MLSFHWTQTSKLVDCCSAGTDASFSSLIASKGLGRQPEKVLDAAVKAHSLQKIKATLQSHIYSTSKLADALESLAPDQDLSCFKLIYEHVKSKFSMREDLYGEFAMRLRPEMLAHEVRYQQRVLWYENSLSLNILLSGVIKRAVSSSNEQLITFLDSEGILASNVRSAAETAMTEDNYPMLDLLFSLHGDLLLGRAIDTLATASLRGNTELLSYLLLQGLNSSRVMAEALHQAGYSNLGERHARQSRISFLEICSNFCEVQNLSAKQLRAKMAKFLEADPQFLPLDAFLPGKDMSGQPFFQVAIISAAVACACAGSNKPQALESFKALMREDMQRIAANPEETWHRYSKTILSRRTNLSTVRDFLEECSSCLVVPAYLNQIGMQAHDLQEDDMGQLILNGAEVAGKILCAGKNTSDVLTLNKRWHAPGVAVPDELRPYAGLGSWYALCPTVTIEGKGSVIPLISADQLRAEGRAQRHCVGTQGYSAKCKKGNTHILSVRDEALVPIGTVELAVSYRSKGTFKIPIGKQAHVQQFKGKGNSVPTKEASEIWRAFCQKANDGQISFSRKSGEKNGGNSKLLNTLTSAERSIGMPLAGIDETIPRILEHYQKRLFVSRKNSQPILAVPLDAKQLADMAKSIGDSLP